MSKNLLSSLSIAALVLASSSLVAPSSAHHAHYGEETIEALEIEEESQKSAWFQFWKR